MSFLGWHFRLALVPAVLGGARILYGSLDALFEGRIGADLAIAVACGAAILATGRKSRRKSFSSVCWESASNTSHSSEPNAPSVPSSPFVRVVVGVCVTAGKSAFWSPTCAPAITSSSSRALVCRPTALSSKAAPHWMSARSTGESLPAERGPGDEVLAGSLNQFGALTIESRRIAEHTVVGQVIELTARALKDKAPLERTADRLARWFLPAVLTLAAVTFAGALVGESIWGRYRDGNRLPFYDATQTTRSARAFRPRWRCW